MPSTFTAAALFILLILPGIVYVAIRERRTPYEQRSAFRETGQVATVSIAVDAVALAVYVAIDAATPATTPDITKLILDGRTYFADVYLLVGAWLASLFALAVLIAAGAAWLLPSRVHVSAMSAWWRLFKARPRELQKRHPDVGTVMVNVGCYLCDGSYITGNLHSYSRLGEDVPDRDLVLAAPIKYRAAGATELKEMDADAICLSARQITRLTVKYHAPSASSADDGGGESTTGGSIG